MTSIPQPRSNPPSDFDWIVNLRTLLVGLLAVALLVTASRMTQVQRTAGGDTEPAASPARSRQLAVNAASPASAATSTVPLATAAIVPDRTAEAPTRRVDGDLPPFTSAREALLMDEDSGEILYSKGAHTSVPPASLTKIATVIVAIERGNLDRVVTVDVDSRTFVDSTLMGAPPWRSVTVRDLVYGLMLPSGNDAAVALGRAVSGSDAAFVAEMNQLVARLGLRDTHFKNARGLDEPGHVSSAYDIAMLSRYGMAMPEFRTIVDAEAYTARGSRIIAMTSLISGMLEWVPGASGVKSGFTDAAGRTLVLTADRGTRLYAVVMNDPQREADTANLMEWGFANHDWGRGAPTATVVEPSLTAPSTSQSPVDGGTDVIRAARAED